MLVLKAIAIAAAVLGGLGLVFGLILALASRVFAIEADPRKGKLLEVLPGTNCGACGFAHCSDYAGAVLEDAGKLGACPMGGAGTAEKMARILGIGGTGTASRRVAIVRCSGSGREYSRYKYEGIQDCYAASQMAAGGPLACRYGCMGFGSCVKACQYGAITVKDGCAVVDEEKCVGCMNCLDACPRSLLAAVPRGAGIFIRCASRDRGADTRAVCSDGCIGCGLCVKACPKWAISVENNLAVIDYTKCNSCGACMEQCPR